MHLDAQNLAKAEAYRLLIGLIVPRPIAWVGTRSLVGRDNLAPFSFFMGVSAEPPSLAISVSRARDGQRKHTSQNILDTGVFTVSAVELPDLDRMHATSADWPDSEFEAVGVAAAPGAQVNAPWVATARAAMECRLLHHAVIGTTDLIVGQIVGFHLDEAIRKNGGIDRDTFAAVARMGGDGYTTLGTFHDRARPRT